MLTSVDDTRGTTSIRRMPRSQLHRGPRRRTGVAALLKDLAAACTTGSTPLVAEGSAWVTGASELGRLAAFVVRRRDFTPDGEIGAVEIRDGDRCARCGGRLSVARGIELGHVFQLGRKYATVFCLEALGPDGRPATITMGCYGVGISRAVAALAEQTHDDKGPCRPRVVAPADVHIVATGRDEAIFETGERLAAELVAAGVLVLLDDRRGVSAGCSSPTPNCSACRPR